MNENDRNLTQLRVALEVRGDGKCYCSYYDCIGLKNRRLLITTSQKHYREKGHAKGGYEYRPLVRGFNI
jgi:hypothetical protein